MNKGGFLQYKCRKCGKIDQSLHAPDAHLALVAIMNDWNLDNMGWASIPVHKTGTCHCSEQEWGVTDLIGSIED